MLIVADPLTLTLVCDTTCPPPPPPSSQGSGNDNSTENTPFTNKVQGDLFRIWLNRYYPSYSDEIDLEDELFYVIRIE